MKKQNRLLFNRIIKFLTKNKKNSLKSSLNKVNLIFWNSTTNFGDVLSLVIVKYFLKRNNLSLKCEVSKTFFLYAVGSILNFFDYDRVVWGSGLLTRGLLKAKDKNIKFDVRLIRGPLSESELKESGFLNKNDIIKYGDPGLIMPLIYHPIVKKKYEISYIPHLLSSKKSNFHLINIKTKNYKKIIKEICSSKLVISSSLHGIIVAETYGVPAVWLKDGNQDEFKFLDYYFSTGRKDVAYASSLNDAIKLAPMKIPNLEPLRRNILNTFPYDLWDVK